MVKITGQVAERMLGDVPQDKRFWCQNGQMLNNLPELETALKFMGDETFRYHSHEARNDFGNWVRDVIGDDKLSRDLLKSTTRTQAAKSVADRVVWLKSKMIPR